MYKIDGRIGKKLFKVLLYLLIIGHYNRVNHTFFSRISP